jgi:hypothetical protein
LAGLFIQFVAEWNKVNNGTAPQPSVIDIFHHKNYDLLEKACIAYTSREGTANVEESGDKSGLMISVYYLLIKAAKIVRVHYLIREERARADDASEFLEVLAFNKHSLIGGAVYNSNRNRQTRLRRPQQLPREEELQRLRTYILQRTKTMLEDPYLKWTVTEYVELRDMACARLTLFNARRGGEPARLKLADWHDASNQVWFDRSRVEAMPAEEKEFFSGCTIMYQTGKGINHLVPVIVPTDTVPALQKLADIEMRKECGILEDNPYLFPSSQSSEGHASGWHTISRVCESAGVQQSEVTATKMRYLASTLYAGLDIPEAKRHAFYRHMGHSQTINENIYEAPLAEVEVREVGAILTQFGENLIFAL